MTLAELRAIARQRLDDVVKPYLWSDNELNIYINKATEEACLRSRCNVDSTTSACSAIKIVPGKSVYPLHPSVFFIERAFLATAKHTLIKGDFDILDSSRRNWRDEQGTPCLYTTDADHFGIGDGVVKGIMVYPMPVAPDVLRLTVHRTPLEPLTSDNDTPDIDDYFHYGLIDFVCSDAYKKNDADASSLDKAQFYDALFTQTFGEKQNMATIEHRRKRITKYTRGNFF